MTVTSTSAPAVKPPPDGARTPRAAALLAGIGGQNISLIGALVVVLGLFAVLNDNYLSLSNMQVIAEAATITGLLAVVQTVVIICGGLDISVVSAMVFTSTGSGTLAGMAAAIGVGVLIGVLNGLVIVYGRVNPTIATLAGLAAYKGLAQLLSDGRAQGFVLGDDVFVFLGRGKLAGIPVMVWILAVVALTVHLLLTHTDIGRNLYAIGGNDTAARLAGILLTARTGSGQPTSGSEGLEGHHRGRARRLRAEGRQGRHRRHPPGRGPAGSPGERPHRRGHQHLLAERRPGRAPGRRGRHPAAAQRRTGRRAAPLTERTAPHRSRSGAEV
ncbi:hypothetical protein ACIA8H_27135 [Streptomyces goshikiensis]|uniref:ABC transporter permease n=1 Tax=Streptomyces goshikiensis TaxID=1942 RepID=UPI0037B6FBE6